MKKKNSLITALVIMITALLVLSGCASAPDTAEGKSQLPQWVISPPKDTQDSVYFVGAGSAADEASARNAAGAELVSSVTRFLGVKVTSETTVKAKDTLKEFTSTLESTIHESSSAVISDFRIIDSYTEKKNGVVNVYLLGEYKKSSLLKEKARIEAVFAEQVNAVSGPESKGDSLLASGDFYGAAVRYMEAASAAAVSDIDNADIKFRRNIDKASRAVSSITLTPVSGELSAYIGKPFPGPFVCKVSGNGKALSGVPVRISYKVMRNNGRMAVRSSVVSSDNGGLVSFTRPAARFVGKDKVTMSLDFSSSLETLDSVRKDLYPPVEALEKMIQSKRAVLPYTVVSRAKEIPTGVYVADEDNSGALTGKTDTASGILEALSKQNFDVKSLPVSDPPAGRSDDEIIRYVKQKYGSSIKRLVFGTAGIAGFQEENGMYSVKVSGDIKVVDLATGKILFSSGTRFKTALGSNLNSAISAAFKQFGKEVGRMMMNTLP